MKAQYTEIINSNRPGFSESPFSVGTGIYQFETSLFLRKDKSVPIFSNPQSLGINFHFRTSFLFERLELNVTTSLQNDRISFKNVFESYKTETGLGTLTLAAKYLVYKPKYTDKTKEIRSWKKRFSFDYRRLIPNIAVYAGYNLGNTLNNPHKHGGNTKKLGILLQNNFSNQFNVITNFYYNYMGSKTPEYSYVITGTYSFNEKWSVFIEHQAMFSKIEKHNNIGAGVTYLFNDNLQFNTNFRENFRNETTGYYAGIGVSYRIDKHIDDYVETKDFNEFGERIIKKETHNKGFWDKLFDSDKKEKTKKLSKKEKRKKEKIELKKKKEAEKRLEKDLERQQKELDELDEELRRLDEALKKENKD
ncbi:MAG: transporter [Tenacibaculum sp.]|nr:transporter [Tenacibaculum sp.]